MQLSEYEFRYVLGLVLAACLIRYFIYSWTLSVIKADEPDAEGGPSGDADCTPQKNEQFIENDPAETKRMYWKWLLIAALFAAATILLIIGHE